MRRRLDAELVRRGLVPSRAAATDAVAAGLVLVGGAPALTPARQVSPDEAITVRPGARPYASRAGEKLADALDRLPVVVEGRRALDAGASTGGFTDCLLQRGAEHVVAVDVGHGQLLWRLQRDPRVTVLDRTNVRTLEPDVIGGPVPLAVADLSFISLRTVAPALARCTTPDADLVLLVKPQFEAGRARVGKRGIVRDPDVHRAVIIEVAEALGVAGLPVATVLPSSVRGADGNQEFLAHCRRDAPATAPDALADRALASLEVAR